MAECRSVVQGTRLRATRLNECGEPVYGPCAYVVTQCFARIAMTVNEEEGTELKITNADGTFCAPPQKTNPQLNWYELEMELNQVDPELFELITGSPLVLDDSIPPVAVGFTTDADSYASTFFALELWTNLARPSSSAVCPAGQARYGYMLLPFVLQGTVRDLEITNAPVSFTVNALTSAGNAWHHGPYDVVLDSTGMASPLLSALESSAHRLFQFTSMPPPDGACGCQSLEFAS
jgi:hypothetical protein